MYAYKKADHLWYGQGPIPPFQPIQSGRSFPFLVNKAEINSLNEFHSAYVGQKTFRKTRADITHL